MSTVTPRLLTAEEFARLPPPADGSQQELLKGVVITMPPPGTRHGICCSKIDRRLGTFTEQHNLGQVTCNDAGFILDRDPDTVLGPDVAYWSKERLPDIPDGYPDVSPDLAVEVVSPHDSSSKLQKKLIAYLKNQVRMVWIVDPEVRTVTVHRALDQSRILEEHDTLSGEDVVPGFTCRVAELFG